MEFLRFSRRDGENLIFSGAGDKEFKIVADQNLLAQVRDALRPTSETEQVRPRDIQRLLRSGKSMQEVAKITGADQETVEKYATPVLSELNFILATARAVPVNTGTGAKAETEKFGEIIDSRLQDIGANNTVWSSLRDEERNWIITAKFSVNDNNRIAQWIFEPQKNLLTPHTPDAVELSKQGSVGEALIPRLRALPKNDSVQDTETTHTDNPFVQETYTPQQADLQDTAEKQAPSEQLKPEPSAAPDLSQTQDLLAQLRQRRSEREMETEQETVSRTTPIKTFPTASPLPEIKPPAVLREEEELDLSESQQVFPAATPKPEPEKDDKPKNKNGLWESLSRVAANHETSENAPTEETKDAEPQVSATEPKQAKRGRSSIPSWDDILFGTRKDGD